MCNHTNAVQCIYIPRHRAKNRHKAASQHLKGRQKKEVDFRDTKNSKLDVSGVYDKLSAEIKCCSCVRLRGCSTAAARGVAASRLSGSEYVRTGDGESVQGAAN